MKFSTSTFQFQPLSSEEIRTLLLRAISERGRGLGHYPIHMHDDALEFLVETSDGDARRALSAQAASAGAASPAANAAANGPV